MQSFLPGPCAAKDHEDCNTYPLYACHNEWLIRNCKRKCGLCQGSLLNQLNFYYIERQFIPLNMDVHRLADYANSELTSTLSFKQILCEFLRMFSLYNAFVF